MMHIYVIASCEIFGTSTFRPVYTSGVVQHIIVGFCVTCTSGHTCFNPASNLHASDNGTNSDSLKLMVTLCQQYLSHTCKRHCRKLTFPPCCGGYIPCKMPNGHLRILTVDLNPRASFSKSCPFSTKSNAMLVAIRPYSRKLVRIRMSLIHSPQIKCHVVNFLRYIVSYRRCYGSARAQRLITLFLCKLTRRLSRVLLNCPSACSPLFQLFSANSQQTLTSGS